MFNKLLSVADSTLVNFVSKLGTAKDKASHDSFGWHIERSILELDNLYQSDSLARKIINRPMQDMFRAGYYFSTPNKALTQKIDELHLHEHLMYAFKLARLHGKSYILLGMADNKALHLPLNGGELKYLSVLRIDQLTAMQDKLMPSDSAGFLDKPVFYQFKNGQQIIHHSRIIVVAWEDETSILQTLYSELVRFASVNANVASLVHEAKVDVIKTQDLMNQINLNADTVLKRFNLIGLLKSNNGMLVLDKESEEYDSKHYSFGGLTDIMREFGIQLSGACDIPYTILFGQSPTGLNSTGEHDLRNYYDTIASYQNWYLRPCLARLFTLMGHNIEFSFLPLWQLDEKTRSEVEKNNADKDIQYLQAGIITESQIARQLIDDGTYTVIDESHIKLLDSLTDN